MGSGRTRLPLNTEWLAGSRLARAIGKSQGRDAASVDMTPASPRFIFLGRSHCLRDRASRTAHVLHTKLRRQLSLSFPPQTTLITPPFKTWVQHGAPALAISFFPLAQSAAPTAWKESLSERQNCLDHSRNHPAVPPRITAGTTMKNTTTWSSKFQIAIPKEVREAQNWEPGQEFAFIPKGGGYLLVPPPTSTTSLASPRAPAPTTTAIARTATDARRRYLGLDRAAHRLPVADTVAQYLPERHSWLVPTIMQLKLAKWLTRERGVISLCSSWRRPSAWPRRHVARAPSRKEPGGRYPPPAGRRRCPSARDW